MWQKTITTVVGNIRVRPVKNLEGLKLLVNSYFVRWVPGLNPTYALNQAFGERR